MTDVHILFLTKTQNCALIHGVDWPIAIAPGRAKKLLFRR
jgi:hypothetical protein